MRLFIAEKPSLARAIADVLPGPHKRSAHHIACGDGNVVAWCAGHILETAPPEAYGPEYKAWRLEHLPIVPKNWKLEVSTPDLLRSIKGLLRRATRVVHAGDPDREGQLLVDEVLEFCGYRGPVDRILVSDLSPDAVRRAIGAIEPNAKYRRLYESALARQRADWLYGINMTRLYTLLGRSAGYDGVLSVGRVQTPVLGLIVRRDLAIESFTPVPYFVLTATLRAPSGATFRATWTPSEGSDRLVQRDVAESLRAKVAGGSGVVSSASRHKKTEAPPLAYSLADLQIDAGRRLGLSAQAVLDACQALYETHRLATYPRSDCSYLPEGHRTQAPEVVAAIRKHAPGLAPLAASADLSLRSKVWNDKKVTAHHAIIPTPNVSGSCPLRDNERAVYELLCRRYLAQFHSPFEYLQTRLEVDVVGERFVASGRQVLARGWKAVLVEEAPDAAQETDGDANAVLLVLREGEAVHAVDAAVAEKRTQPLQPFDDASLVQAMCAIGRFVSDPRVKKILTDTDGIGTPATRAAIIETLFARGYVTRAKKHIVSTPTGRALIESLPEVATMPDMTAIWEAAMRAMTEGTQTLDAFLDRVTAQLTELVAQGRALGRLVVPNAEQRRPAPQARASARTRP